MRFNIISNISNGAGLERDYLILKGLLEEKGHAVQGVMFDGYSAPQADINIFLEVVTPRMMKAAADNWVIPNPEWWFGEVWDRELPKFSRVLCKTLDCFRIFEAKAPGRCKFIGFESKDFYDASVERKPAFLHMAGKSETKNTAAVVGAWKRYEIPYPLTVVAFKPSIIRHCAGIQNVTHIMRVAEEDLPRMMNEHLFHVMPSKYEGFGHYIHEVTGCGNLVITTNAPPMNGFGGVPQQLLIRASQKVKMREAITHLVSEGAVAHAVNEAARLSESTIKELSAAARAAFLEERSQFRQRFAELV